MRTQTSPVLVETKYGTLYVAVASADRRSYRDMKRGDVTDLRPEVWVSTTPQFDADPGAEQHWTIRGRAYAVRCDVIFEERTDGTWHRIRTPYAGGFRNDRRGEVEFGTKTFDLMWEAVVTALDAFAARHPGWEDVSRYLLFSGDAARAESRAADARKEAAKHDADAANARMQGERFAGVLPTSGIVLTG